MRLITTHTHTLYSNHGEGSVEELVDAAYAAGIRLMAITEHFPLSEAFDPKRESSMSPEQAELYLSDIADAQKNHPDMRIIVGTELDYLGDDEDRPELAGSLERFELVLGSVHFVDKWAFDDPAERSEWEKPGKADEVWERYIELWCRCATSDLPINVLSHPDLAKKFAYYPGFDLAPAYTRMAEAAASAGRMIEVNTSGSYYDCKEMFPAPELLAAFCRAGVPCTVGTDAHTPSNVARDIAKAYEYMQAAGYRELTVPLGRGERLVIPFDSL